MFLELLEVLGLASASGVGFVLLLLLQTWTPPTRGKPLAVWVASTSLTVMLAAVIALRFGYLGWFAFGLVIAGIPISFMVWSVLHWGATVTMWRVMRETSKPLSLSEWQEAVSNGKSASDLVANRLSLLKRIHLVKRYGNSQTWVPSPLGNIVIQLSRVLARRSLPGGE